MGGKLDQPIFAAEFPPRLRLRASCVDILHAGLEGDVLRIISQLETNLVNLQGEVLVVQVLLQLDLLPQVVVQLAVGDVQRLSHSLLDVPDILHLRVQADFNLILHQIYPLPPLSNNNS